LTMGCHQIQLCGMAELILEVFEDYI